MCYEALKNSNKYFLDYSESKSIDFSYDFVIINYHHQVNNWITLNELKKFKKKNFCVVTEVTFGASPINMSPDFFDHYIVLDPTINEDDCIHAFGRPLEKYAVSAYKESDVPIIGSFGLATYGKAWDVLIQQVHNEFDFAKIVFNIPTATFVPFDMHSAIIADLQNKSFRIIKKKGVSLEITSHNYTKKELIDFCSNNTINCFFYNRASVCPTGLAAATDQAISSGRPLLVSEDRTFRHIHKYIPHFPNITIKEAIASTKEGVLQMKNDWSTENFRLKFERILFNS
jgi:hypothetical protein